MPNPQATTAATDKPHHTLGSPPGRGAQPWPGTSANVFFEFGEVTGRVANRILGREFGKQTIAEGMLNIVSARSL